MEINVSKFHVEKGYVQGVICRKNHIGLEIIVGSGCHFKDIAHNDFNHPLAMCAILLKNLWDGHDVCYVLMYAKGIIGIAPSIQCLAKNVFYPIDAKQHTILRLKAYKKGIEDGQIQGSKCKVSEL